MSSLARIAHRGRLLYWKLFRPRTRGVRAILLNEAQSRVLLVRHTYEPWWYLPGGGVKRSETETAALGRELAEEVGVTYEPGAPEVFGTYSATAEGKRDHVTLFVVRAWNRRERSSREIAESREFPIAALPPDTSPATARRIKEFLGERSAGANW